ncbi:MAG: Rnf-Nqr domain containing protein [Pseudohongiellaceae bacterium]
MNAATDFMTLLVAAVLVNNLAVVQLLGVSAFFAASKRVSNAVYLGSLTAVTIAITVPVNYLARSEVLSPAGLEILDLIVFASVAACCAIMVCRIAGRYFPLSARRLHWQVLLVGGNSGVLGLALLHATSPAGFVSVLVTSAGAAFGFLLVTVLFAAMRERLQYADVPTPFQGPAIALVSAGLVAMAFLGFTGLA